MVNKVHSDNSDTLNEFDMIEKIQQKLKSRFEPANASYELKEMTGQIIQDCSPDFNIEDWR